MMMMMGVRNRPELGSQDDLLDGQVAAMAQMMRWSFASTTRLADKRDEAAAVVVVVVGAIGFCRAGGLA